MSKNNKSFNLKTREKDQSQRQLKVSQGIYASLIDCFRKEGRVDIRLSNCPLSITKVNVSSDLRVANCFFVPFNTTLSADEILVALEESRFVIRDFVTRKINLKYSPEIRFYYDAAYENFAIIGELLNK